MTPNKIGNGVTFPVALVCAEWLIELQHTVVPNVRHIQVTLAIHIYVRSHPVFSSVIGEGITDEAQSRGSRRLIEAKVVVAVARGSCHIRLTKHDTCRARAVHLTSPADFTAIVEAQDPVIAGVRYVDMELISGRVTVHQHP